MEVVDVAYGSLPAAAFSEYKTADMAYRYNYIEVSVLDTVLILQPIDFVGETMLEPGLYTYRLDVTNGMTSLSLEFVDDD